MASRERPRDRALETATRAATDVGAQVRRARRGSGISVRAAASAVGMDDSTFQRIERHLLPNVSIRQLALACAAVGLELSVRTFLSGDPVRDAGQLRLLARFRARLPAAAPWATEVPLPIPGDLRALDGWTQIQSSTIGVEAETRLSDIQAIERKALLKKRDANLERLILLVADTERTARSSPCIERRSEPHSHSTRARSSPLLPKWNPRGRRARHPVGRPADRSLPSRCCSRRVK